MTSQDSHNPEGKDELSSHTGKVMYETRISAEKRIKSLRHSRLYPYKCSFCEGWHVGNITKKKGSR